MKLYELSSQYRQALTVFEDIDLSDLNEEQQHQLINDTLEPIEDDFKTKALSIGSYIANLDLEAEALKTMEKRIEQRRKANERKVNWLKDYLHNEMKAINLLTIKDSQISLNVRKNPGRVIIENETLLPDNYKEAQTTILVRKSLIAEALKAGHRVPGAALHNGTRLDIRWLMQTILMLAGFIQATVLLGFWGVALSLLICVIILIYKLIGPILIKFLF